MIQKPSGFDAYPCVVLQITIPITQGAGANPHPSGKEQDMHKNGVILLLVLLCVAFLVSCGKRQSAERTEQSELVRIETEDCFPQSQTFYGGKR